MDLISTDITRPWHENGAILNEVNFKPFFGGNLDNDKVHPYMEALVDVLAHLCGHSSVESPSGKALHLLASGLFMRCRALLQNPDVQALIVVVDSDEFLKTGLPLDRFDEVHMVGKPATATVTRLWRQLTMAKPTIKAS